MILNNNTEQLEALFNFVMGSDAGGTMFDKGYADAWSDQIVRPQHDDSEYRKGWALGFKFKGK